MAHSENGIVNEAAPWVIVEVEKLETLSDLLCVYSAIMPMGYAKVLRPRVASLLTKDLPRSIRRQLQAVMDALSDKALCECVGLDRLHFCIREWEIRYA